ncbi:hypothetical protein ECPA45_2437, partial [Escherichia coli PA45]
MNVLHQFTTCS